ncbi:phosphodiester glycosidase family protein [Calothrix sp. FACHB-1219]|uniref:phosphodiester glycosidase family protein n=1 Tax=unclassified Calothrix TaxID=2619626 RepID=UPI0016839733|nr:MULTISPECIES: phosphodiester glycosidase family protein [unclassified Calothrix]MBD2206000.1 phosphodiester glycosidase family protein [Calothrix sp. FACHB-168]MBD2220825.1 phosphodiester glycosidase family protein [Calothrix sp. FACHB-1219]
MSRLFLISIFVVLLNLLSGCKSLESNAAQEPGKSTACIGKNANFSIDFFKTNNQGKKFAKGINHVIIFNPKSAQLDFKVNVGLAHKLYAKDNRGNLRKEYIPKQFREIITDENSRLNGQKPIAAINADYIDTDNKPQGLNISRGVEYSGAFKTKRSSFGISGGKPQERKATIQAGRRSNEILNYNLVGGNGRFYRNGNFKDICADLGEFACKQATNRSLAAITDKGYVILLVNDAKANSNIEFSAINQELFPDKFDDVLEGIARNNCLGNIQEGILFDGGMSPGLYYNNQIYVENPGPIGSVFLVYKR